MSCGLTPGAPAQRQHDGRDARHQQDERRDLRGIGVAGEQRRAQGARVRIIRRQRAARLASVAPPRCRTTMTLIDRKHDEARHGHRQRPVAGEFLAQLLDVDVEHHDHEQEQHHDGADIHQHQHDPQEFRVQQQPDDGAVEEAQHQQQRANTPGCAPGSRPSAAPTSTAAKMKNRIVGEHQRYRASAARSAAIMAS